MKHKLYISEIKHYVCCMFAMFLLIACSGGGGGGSSSNGGGGGNNVVKGSLSFNYNGTLQITKGSIQQIYLKLNNSQNVSGLNVVVAAINQQLTGSSIAATGSQVATVSPSVCSLSTDSPNCQITVYGLKDGTVSIGAVADGYSSVSIPGAVGDSVVYGYLGVESSLFLDQSSMESGSPISIKFSTYAPISGYYTINVTGGLLFSSGVSNNNAFFNVKGNGPIVINTSTGANQNQCAVTSQQPVCTLTFYVPESAVAAKVPLSLTALIAGSAAPSYTPSTLIPVGDPNKYPGTIELSTQTSSTANPNNANIPVDMSAPLFVNWNRVAINGVVNVTLTAQNPSIVSFYHFAPGNNTTRVTSSSATCTLQYPPVPGFGLSCGLGIRGLTTGSAQITAVATANNGQQYTISPLNLTVVNQAATIKSIKFTNNSTESIAVGITSGGANAYVSPKQAAVIPGAPGANIKPGGGSECGVTNPLAACPIGSSCLQGGTSPSPTSVYYCFYDQTLPTCGSTGCSNNYVLSPGGSTTFNISGSSGESDPTGIIWSGNYFARTNCNATTGVCENATCNGANGGLSCGPGTGGSPGINTLAEVTFQRGNVDFYDVSIINGINFATSFGPASPVVPLPTNAYNCGTAGSAVAQAGGWSQSNQTAGGLPAALWATAPSESSFPTSVAPESAASYYRLVRYNATSATCTQDSTCTGGEVCGYWVATAYNGLSGSSESVINSASANYVKHCGVQIAWITADSIFGLNRTGTNIGSLPFNFTESFAVPASVTTNFTVGDLQLCINYAFSSYNAQPTPVSTFGNPILACGGVSWNLESGGYITRVEQPVITVGPQWVTNVLPTLNWMKQSCPTCYTYPFDDMSSTFTCLQPAGYNVIFSNLNN